MSRSSLRSVALAMVAGCSVFLMACSSSSSSSSTTTAPREHTGTSVIAPGGTVPFNLSHNARADLVVAPCTQEAGHWVLQGTVTNRAKTTKSFQIVVDFVTKPGSTVLSSSVVNVSGVAPGATTHWSATGAPGHTDVACIIRQAQTT
jgi:hypothetical protein